MENDTRSNPGAGAKLERGELAGLDKIIVAIHGIGSQQRSATIRSVTNYFGSRRQPPLPLLPLGYFHIEDAARADAKVKVSRLRVPDASDPLNRIGFAEVFWADIPRTVEQSADTLEETKAWGRTVVSRAEAEYRKNVTDPCLESTDFDLVASAVDEIIETIAVLENLFAIAERAGLFKFDLAPLLRDYIGDVQIVTEFKYYRRQIVDRFHTVMEQVFEEFRAANPGRVPELYVVAHSEGTVISFLGLLEALSGTAIDPPTDQAPRSRSMTWVECVRGFMTIGSPIDKHLILWPDLWLGLHLKSSLDQSGIVFAGTDGAPRLTLPSVIRWRNYYDRGDPIGYDLGTARKWLKDDQKCCAFEFEDKPTGQPHDIGFSRYLLPGKAHNDYWTDKDVFGHFIGNVVIRAGKLQDVPGNRFLAGTVSTAIPYAASFLCHAVAVFVLFKGMTVYTQTNAETGAILLELAGLTVLMASVTVAARLPRLVKRTLIPHRHLKSDPDTARSLREKAADLTAAAKHIYKYKGRVQQRWYWGAVIAFSLGATAYLVCVTCPTRTSLGRMFAWIPWPTDPYWLSLEYIGIVLLSSGVALSGWAAPRKPRLARRFLLVCGAAVVVWVVGFRIWDNTPTGGAAGEAAPLWPILLAGSVFLYLWWLGLLLFDLAFLWHRYIRLSWAMKNLRRWSSEKSDGECSADTGGRMGTPAPSSTGSTAGG